MDPGYARGRGKLEDVVIRAMQLDAETLIFDCNLRPAQANNIARMADMRVVDRTQLILDIFAQRAESSDGKLQVELAQMQYLLPRLGQRDDALSRLTGGIGGRGPGETKLEVGALGESAAGQERVLLRAAEDEPRDDVNNTGHSYSTSRRHSPLAGAVGPASARSRAARSLARWKDWPSWQIRIIRNHK